MVLETGQINSSLSASHPDCQYSTGYTSISQPRLVPDQYTSARRPSVGPHHWSAPASVLVAGPMRALVTSQYSHTLTGSLVTGGCVVRPVAGPGEPLTCSSELPAARSERGAEREREIYSL